MGVDNALKLKERIKLMNNNYNDNARNVFSWITKTLSKLENATNLTPSLDRYVLKKQKRRYKRFNDRIKHPKIYNHRLNKDTKFFLKHYGNRKYQKQLNLPIMGYNKPLAFLGLWRDNLNTWYDILLNWLIFLGVIFLIGSIAYFFTNKQSIEQLYNWIYLSITIMVVPIILKLIIGFVRKKYEWLISKKKKAFFSQAKNKGFGK